MPPLRARHKPNWNFRVAFRRSSCTATTKTWLVMINLVEFQRMDLDREWCWTCFTNFTNLACNSGCFTLDVMPRHSCPVSYQSSNQGQLCHCATHFAAFAALISNLSSRALNHVSRFQIVSSAYTTCFPHPMWVVCDMSGFISLLGTS